MQQTIVRVICAIGQSGQMGLEGRLPWEGDRSPVYKADAARFFDITRGQVLAAGPKTISSVPEFARSDRDLFVLRSSIAPGELFKRFAGRIVFIGGGPAVWDVYAPFVSHWDITRLPYDGRADRWFNPQWLTPPNAK
jgi:dihydromethanopterin reductase